MFFVFLIVVPAPHFDDPYSTVLLDKEGNLLSAQVATDEQWRFEEGVHLPEKYITSLLNFEDRYYYYHPGVNPVSIVKALVKDIRAWKVVSGGSTISMQLARLSGKKAPRNVWMKSWEILKALKAEVIYSKKTILKKYAAHAPFGSNVVGIEAACWRFFGTDPEVLSWAQAATLAVLPNSPALIFPGKNQEKLLRKRNSLLLKLKDRKIIDEQTYSLAIQEPVPGLPKNLPQAAPELATRLMNSGKAGKRIITSLDIQLQNQVMQIIDRYHKIYRDNQVYNAAALVMDVQTGKVLVYVGNVSDTSKKHGSQVDIITAKRSYGSLLKPILYAASLEEGKICPKSLLPDYPISFGGFNPKNFNVEFEGLAPADQALIRSLNVPNVFLLQNYSTPLFLNTLKNLGMTTFTQPASHYGLSLILGGAESNLWELTNAYAALANHLETNRTAFKSSYFENEEQDKTPSIFHTDRFHSPSIWTTFNALSNLFRPGADGHWEQFSSAQKIAWKTGTSFGNRDGWAIGVTPKYAVGVWVGNASGEGMSNLIGAHFAAPILFDIYSLLPADNWFKRPNEGWVNLKICKQSGFKASENCPDANLEIVPKSCLYSPICRFHKIINLDPSAQFRVNSSCVSPSEMVLKSFFVLAPIEEWYYQKKHSDYIPLPPMMQGCDFQNSTGMMSLIYPSNHAKIYIPKERDGRRGKIVVELAHRSSNATIYWHLDSHYLGMTQHTHKMELEIAAGEHVFSFMDNEGELIQATVTFLQQ